jgi:glycerophosphoryl diester phosphodiesterase
MHAYPALSSGQKSTPSIVAHRGASKARAENTIAAFEAALDYGSDAIELDIRWTADNTAIIFHDQTVTREGRKVPVKKLPADELVRLKNAEHIHVPTMGAALRWARDKLPLVFDIKDTGREREFIAEVEECGFHTESVFSSFRLTVIGKIKALRPEWQTAWIIGNSGSTAVRRLLIAPIITRALRWGVGALHFHESWITPEIVDRCHTRNLRVAAWTVDDPDGMRVLADAGVDTIITNVPDTARAALRRNPPAAGQ